MTVGQYTMLSMVANSFEVAMEPGLEPLPSSSSGRGYRNGLSPAITMRFMTRRPG